MILGSLAWCRNRCSRVRWPVHTTHLQAEGAHTAGRSHPTIMVRCVRLFTCWPHYFHCQRLAAEDIQLHFLFGNGSDDENLLKTLPATETSAILTGLTPKRKKGRRLPLVLYGDYGAWYFSTHTNTGTQAHKNTCVFMITRAHCLQVLPVGYPGCSI